MTTEPLTYDHREHSYFHDLINTHNVDVPDPDARERLIQHGKEVAERDEYAAHRDGGYAAPPLRLYKIYENLVETTRPYINAMSLYPMPPGTDTFHVPTTTGDLNVPVRTIAGMQSIAQQLLEQSPINFDDIVMRDLAADYLTKQGTQVFTGAGMSGEMRGIANTPGIHKLTNIPEACLPEAILLASSIIDSRRGEGPTIIALPTTLHNNLEKPHAFGPSTTAVVSEPRLNRNTVHVARAEDSILYESSIRARTLKETRPTEIDPTTGEPRIIHLLQIYAYNAFTAGRFHGTSIVTVELDG
ncbi:phage major capsid protein [Mycolicibacterium sphagni]|uniref:phage major capsid protein n=1 Tax=Mycolicibacterium sphagni TaxID=1786 RepID=UPI0021F3A44F|nr:phage major capsid protein [Mycolicibacterium sphagni]MCV7175089.1 phage major capsid protein [Mycolicibacterium sphagni]